jgi:hypothetical protein
VQRGLDRETVVPVYGRSAAERVVALEHQHAQSGLRTQRASGEAAESGADHDRIEAARHGACLQVAPPWSVPGIGALMKVKVRRIVLCMRFNPLGLAKATENRTSAAFDAD